MRLHVVRPLAAVAGFAVCAGCIFLSPATGWRLGDHTQEFANSGSLGPTSPSVTTITWKTYSDKNFSIQYPDFWQVGTTIDQPTGQAGSGATTRVVIGAATTSGEVMGITLTTLDPADLDPVASTANSVLEGIVRQNLAQGYNEFTEIGATAVTVGGEAGYRTEGRGTDPMGAVTHLVGESTIHDLSGWILVIQSPENSYQTYSPVFDEIFRRFSFIPTVSPSPSATAVPTPGATQPSSSASATESPAATSTAEPSPSASAAESPSATTSP